MAKKKNTEKEVINNLKEKLNETPDTIKVVKKEETEPKMVESEKEIEKILDDVKNLKENKIEKILSDVKENEITEENVEKIEKEIENVIKEGEKLKSKIEEALKPEPKIRSSFTNYWNGTYFDI